MQCNLILIFPRLRSDNKTENKSPMFLPGKCPRVWVELAPDSLLLLLHLGDLRFKAGILGVHGLSVGQILILGNVQHHLRGSRGHDLM